MTNLYFAYGSNIAPDRLLKRCPQAQPIAATQAQGWRLAFTGWSSGWSGGVATIQRGSVLDGHSVPGALYEMTDEDMTTLDRYEGAPWCYRRAKILTDAGPAWTYIKIDDTPCSPSSEYFNTILRGYDVFGLDHRVCWQALTDAIADDPGCHGGPLHNKMVNRVFVYGSLRRGFYNHSVLHGATLLSDRAVTARRWHMVSIGGAYPAVVRGIASKTKITGEIYGVSAEGLDRLDRLEGHPSYYTRQLIAFDQAGGLAWCYTMSADQANTYEGDPAALSGDWANHHARQRPSKRIAWTK